MSALLRIVGCCCLQRSLLWAAKIFAPLVSALSFPELEKLEHSRVGVRLLSLNRKSLARVAHQSVVASGLLRIVRFLLERSGSTGQTRRRLLLGRPGKRPRS